MRGESPLALSPSIELMAATSSSVRIEPQAGGALNSSAEDSGVQMEERLSPLSPEVFL